jgi:hypothetical protein
VLGEGASIAGCLFFLLRKLFRSSSLQHATAHCRKIRRESEVQVEARAKQGCPLLLWHHDFDTWNALHGGNKCSYDRVSGCQLTK